MPPLWNCTTAPMPTNRHCLTAAITVAATLSLAACQLPRVHKITVQQGNVITQDMIDKLKPGMTKSQVVFVMGEPVFRNPFDANRWDYIYTIEVPGYYDDERRVSLYFENDVLAFFTGDLAPTEAATDAAADPDVDPENVDASTGDARPPTQSAAST